MCQQILEANREVIPCSAVYLLIIAEKYDLKDLIKRSIFFKAIAQRIGTSTSVEATIGRRSCLTKSTKTYILYEDNFKEPQVLPDIENIANNNGDVNQQPIYDRLIYANVTLQCNNELI